MKVCHLTFADQKYWLSDQKLSWQDKCQNSLMGLAIVGHSCFSATANDGLANVQVTLQGGTFFETMHGGFLP